MKVDVVTAGYTALLSCEGATACLAFYERSEISKELKGVDRARLARVRIER